MAKHASIVHLEANTRKKKKNWKHIISKFTCVSKMLPCQICHRVAKTHNLSMFMHFVCGSTIASDHHSKSDQNGSQQFLRRRTCSLLVSEEHGNSKHVVHPPSQALCTYNPLIKVKRLKHENPQCQIEWKLQLKQKYLKDAIWNACCRLLLRTALKPLIWNGRSVFLSKIIGIVW